MAAFLCCPSDLDLLDFKTFDEVRDAFHQLLESSSLSGPEVCDIIYMIQSYTYSSGYSDGWNGFKKDHDDDYVRGFKAGYKTGYSRLYGDRSDW